MAVILEIDGTMSSNCKNLKFYELTGAYNASTNTTGWGSPNETVADATSAELTILTPDEIAYTFDASSLTPFYSTFPTANTTIYYNMDSSLLGYGTNQKLPDGVYRLSYEVVTGTATYTQVEEKLLYGNAKCCVFNMFADIDYSCDCSSDKLEKAKKAYLMLMGLEAASDCGQKDKFNNLLEDLEKLCAGSCTNC